MFPRKMKAAYENTSYGREGDTEGFNNAWNAVPFECRDKLNSADLALFVERFRSAYRWGYKRGYMAGIGKPQEPNEETL